MVQIIVWQVPLSPYPVGAIVRVSYRDTSKMNECTRGSFIKPRLYLNFTITRSFVSIPLPGFTHTSFSPPSHLGDTCKTCTAGKPITACTITSDTVCPTAAQTRLCPRGSTFSLSGYEPCTPCKSPVSCGAAGVKAACTEKADTVCHVRY